MFVFYSKSQTGVWTNSVLKTSRTKIKQRGVPESGSEGGTIHDVELAVEKDDEDRGSNQGHFLSTHCFPPSSYSCLEIHICWKVPWRMQEKCLKDSENTLVPLMWYRHEVILCVLTRDARMEPPIQALNRRSTVVLFAISFNLILCKSTRLKISQKMMNKM